MSWNYHGVTKVWLGGRLIYSGEPIQGAWQEAAPIPVGWDERDSKGV